MKEEKNRVWTDYLLWFIVAVFGLAMLGGIPDIIKTVADMFTNPHAFVQDLRHGNPGLDE